MDGSNLATEGRTLPSLEQLDEAVRAYAEEDPDSRITVVVDASFEHRIDESERETTEGEEHAECDGAAPSFATLGFPEQHLRGRAGRLGHRPVRGARPAAGSPEMDDRH